MGHSALKRRQGKMEREKERKRRRVERGKRQRPQFPTRQPSNQLEAVHPKPMEGARSSDARRAGDQPFSPAFLLCNEKDVQEIEWGWHGLEERSRLHFLFESSKATLGFPKIGGVPFWVSS